MFRDRDVWQLFRVRVAWLTDSSVLQLFRGRVTLVSTREYASSNVELFGILETLEMLETSKF